MDGNTEIPVPSVSNVDIAGCAETCNHNESNNDSALNIGKDENAQEDNVSDSSPKVLSTLAQDDRQGKEKSMSITKEKRLFDSDLEDNGVRKILKELTEEEKNLMPDENEAMRHFRAEKGDVDKAIKKIKYALKWRKDFGVSKLTTAFYEDSSSATPNPDLAASRTLLLEESMTGKLYASGYDRNGRAILYMFPRNECSTNSENNVKNIVYQMERAIACTGKNGFEKIVILVDFMGWSMKVAPPMKVTKQFLHILQECYPERSYKIYAYNAPLLFRVFWKMVQPFIDPLTKSKIIFCSKKAGKETLNDDFDMDKLHQNFGGTAELRKFDAEEYLQMPMHLSFDEKADDNSPQSPSDTTLPVEEN